MPLTDFLLGVALFLVELAILATDAALWRPGVTEANTRRIREGMTLREVEGLLGSEPDREVMRTDRCGGDWLNGGQESGEIQNPVRARDAPQFREGGTLPRTPVRFAAMCFGVSDRRGQRVRKQPR